MDEKIFVIEDNEQNRYLLSFILENNGYQVIATRDGLEGISKAKEEKPDMILVDIRLPVMDGSLDLCSSERTAAILHRAHRVVNNTNSQSYRCRQRIARCRCREGVSLQSTGRCRLRTRRETAAPGKAPLDRGWS